MDIKTAKKMMESKSNTSIYYKNTPVCIKGVDKEKGTVSLKNLNTDKDFVVSVKTINTRYGMK
ncbi:H-type small acid-soluble spore protein [Clostridium aestuarii]|uniref:H-type small acid-soluble spore protein n=1 Tax=Clostridium aestuarii TaxID=338193 RepID=A0ABT4CWL0_9CLOT|nr:H-type small acid-soluble spore protein [Clostridium aestuarii]MCY6483378.1 H-type small acid-soluble spore protein [Clostridium aestuarii]